MDLTERGDGAVRHPWEVQRFKAYRGVLSDHGALSAMRVLDVGAGDGWFSDSLSLALPDDAEIVCWDINYDANDLEPSTSGVVRTRDTPTPGFDLILALDVLEHIDDPTTFISDVLARLASSGTPALVAVPAYQRLFGSHDEALGHVRRYGRSQLIDQLSPWIDVAEHGSLFTTLLAPRAAAVAVERIRPGRTDEHGVGGWNGGPALSAVVNAALAADARIGRALNRRGVRLPGLSHWAFGVTR